MSDPKYNTYAGELRFDDDNIVDVNLEPDTENITVKLNGVEITSGGGDLPEVDSGDNGKVLTVVEGEWAAAAQATELPAVSGADNGNVLTVVEGAWAKADPPTELPAVTGADNGNVLTVVNGAWAKAGAVTLTVIALSEISDISDLLPSAPQGYEWVLETYNSLSSDGVNPMSISDIHNIDLMNTLLVAGNVTALPCARLSYNDFDSSDPQADMKIKELIMYIVGSDDVRGAGISVSLQRGLG